MKELIYHRHFMTAVNRFRDRLAAIDGAFRVSFERHADRVFRLKHAFGLARQDRFAVLARNSHACFELSHAAFLGSGVINPLNLRFSAKELDYIIRDFGAQIMFVDRHFANFWRRPARLMHTGPMRALRSIRTRQKARSASTTPLSMGPVRMKNTSSGRTSENVDTTFPQQRCSNGEFLL